MYKESTSAKDLAKAKPAVWGAVPPSDFKKVYGDLQPVDSSNFTARVFANGVGNHKKPLVTRQPVEILTGIYSFHPTVLRFQRALAETLNDALPVDTDKDGFSRTGIHTPFDRIKCVPGYVSNPISFVPVNNESYRAELGLTKMTQVQRTIAKEVWHIVLSEVCIKSVNVAKLSTGGMRRFSVDVQWKLAYAEWLFEPDNFEEMLNAVKSNDWMLLANKFETVYAMYMQKRTQVDAPGKPRKVFDLMYAMTSGAKGEAFNTDKRVVIDGQVYDDFSAVRARVVQAGPWVVNCFLQIVATTTMLSMFERFPTVFHVNTADEIKAVIDGKHVFCSDVTEYDRSMAEEDIQIPHDVMREYWDERICMASERLMFSPYYARPLSLTGKQGVWVGDPTDVSSRVVAGNRSGHALTSLIAKVNKVIDTLIVINHIYPVVGRCKFFLEGKGTIGFVNNGDDEIVWADNKSDLERFKVLRADLTIGRYKVEPEVGQGFSGLLLLKTGETSYNPSPKVHTTFEKMLVPERSIGGMHRQFWTIGAIERINNIMKLDTGQVAWEIFTRLYRDIMFPEFNKDFMKIIYDAHAALEVKMAGLTENDRSLLDDPNKIAYKFTPDDVSASVLEMVTSKIPPFMVERIVTKYYKGHIS